MHKLLTIIFIFGGLALKVNAQSQEPINTDRPDQGDATYTLPKKSFQLETGLTYGKQESNYLFHNTMLRYGLTPKTEVRLLLDYGNDGAETGVMPFTLSVKRQVISQKGLIPGITAVGYIGLPFTATYKFKPDHIPSSFLLAFQNEVSEKLSVGYNFGTSNDGNDPHNNWLFVTSLSLAPTEVLSFFTEYFSQFSQTSIPDHNIDIGVLWLLTNKLQLDLAVGSTIFQDNKNQFMTTGISYRFNK